MSDLSEESKAVLEEARFDEATSAELEATRQRVYAALGITPPPAGPTSPPDGGAAPPATSAAGGGASLAKGLAGSAVVAALVGGGLLVQHAASRDRAPEPAVVVAPVETATAPPPSPESTAPPAAPTSTLSVPEAPTALVRPPQRKSEATSKPSAAASAQAAPSEEALLVAAAEAQLRAGQPAAALSLYDRYLRQHPAGLLRQEALAGRILALCGTGQTARGRTELEAFAARYPGSPSLPRLRRACGSEP